MQLRLLSPCCLWLAATPSLTVHSCSVFIRSTRSSIKRSDSSKDMSESSEPEMRDKKSNCSREWAALLSHRPRCLHRGPQTDTVRSGGEAPKYLQHHEIKSKFAWQLGHSLIFYFSFQLNLPVFWNILLLICPLPGPAVVPSPA